ncbi:hypothetical protein M404DRAFT_993893 [Pisolithus tinctorius Marx 270]|uniref:Uncharacterized protein n=1 Tax=Pisolithus tinctorius Marx 270 TaxID=870435 RepID=A0A0C3PVN6_PISTI|nr:hypothetical protein M404DRAFT_993893 [Pisolithus tinctorius Marx 270]
MGRDDAAPPNSYKPRLGDHRSTGTHNPRLQIVIFRSHLPAASRPSLAGVHRASCEGAERLPVRTTNSLATPFPILTTSVVRAT